MIKISVYKTVEARNFASLVLGVVGKDVALQGEYVRFHPLKPKEKAPTT